jgi:hypothetical protein
MKLTGENRSTGGKTCPSATLSTTNPTRTDPVSNPGLGGERPATNRLSHKAEVLWEKSVPVPLCPPQIPHGLTRYRTRASALRGRRLTA